MSRNATAIKTPPETTNAEGETRRVGVEIEFAGVTVANAARLIERHYGGEAEIDSAHRIAIRATEFGDFTIELDAQIVHKSGDDAEADAIAGDVDIEGGAREALGHAVAGLVPTEVVCPPIPWDRLDRLDRLFDALREAGAEGTDAGALYGFGLHLRASGA